MHFFTKVTHKLSHLSCYRYKKDKGVFYTEITPIEMGVCCECRLMMETKMSFGLKYFLVGIFPIKIILDLFSSFNFRMIVQ